MAYLDQKEITHFLAQELLYQQFITLDGLNSGVPTRTTPTLTPTTLRNIEQTFIELQSTKNESHENEAGFVPPLVHAIGNNQYISASDPDLYNSKSQHLNLWPSSLSQSSSDSVTNRTTPPLSSTKSGSSSSSRRNMGGRKPAKNLGLDPEEEEKRKVRRERNKAAAARCRKRRVDHTNALIKETEELEAKKQKLQEEMQELRMIKDHIELLLETHRNSRECRLNKPHNTSNNTQQRPTAGNSAFGVNLDRVKIEKDEPIDEPLDPFILPSPTKKLMLSSTVPIPKPNRPNFLNVATAKTHLMSEIAGIPISTPSSGMQFNFDSLMGGGTGLTPVSTPLVPSCSSQQRNVPVSLADVSTPDAKLVSL